VLNNGGEHVTPNRSFGLTRRDAWGLAIVATTTAALITYRAIYIEPRAWGAICATAEGAPLACASRAALFWLQRQYLWGGFALALGLVAFLCRGPFVIAVTAVVMGMAAVENYNATWGMVGAALGVWAWLAMNRKSFFFEKKNQKTFPTTPTV
jgi:hypothetical protein